MKNREKIANLVLVAVTALLYAGALTLAYFYVQGAFSQAQSFEVPDVLFLGLSFSVDGFRVVYGLVVTFMWFMTTLLSKDYFHGHHQLVRYFIFTIVTLFATLGVFFADNLYTSFVFFEVMSLASFVWVVQEETEGAIKAANTYLGVAVIGGLTALMGIFLLQHTFGTTEIGKLYELAAATENKSLLYTAGALILVGYGAKAGMFPLHIWLPEAHPVAPAPASALLSGVLTKSGIVGVLVLSCNLFRYDPAWGKAILLLGTITMSLGAVLALFSVNLKRTLACSSMSQIGFILVGIGMMGILGEENVLAARGTLLHMMNHSLFKLVLFSCAGVIYMNAHTLNLNELRGFGRKKPVLLICFLIGALGIGGIPGFSGYVSKTLLHEALVEGKETFVEWIFLASGGLTLAYMTKLFVCIFVEHGEGEKLSKDHDGLFSKLAICIPAVLIPFFGLTPNWSMDGIATFGTDFFHTEALEESLHYFSLENLKGTLFSVLFGAAFYFGIVRTWMMKDDQYVNRWPQDLNLENGLYRPMLLQVLPMIFGAVARLFGENIVTTKICKGLLRFVGIVAHAFADSLDGLLYLFRKTIFKPVQGQFYDKVSNAFSFKVGHALDAATHHKEEEEEEENHFGALSYRLFRTFQNTTHQLMDTLSFALLMLTLAIVFILLYVLFLH